MTRQQPGVVSKYGPPPPDAPGPKGSIPKTVQVVGCATVDKSSNDTDHFLHDVRTRMNLPGHLSTEGAVTNLENCLNGAERKAANIIGHGCDGCISTGIGDDLISGAGSNNPCVIRFDNEPFWTVLERLKEARVASLTLWGCWTGAGAKGARLLWEVAQLINAPVSAPTGLIHPGLDASHLLVQHASRMQCARPGKPKPPIIPRAHLYDFFTPLNWLDLNLQGSATELPAANLREMRFYSGNTSEAPEWVSPPARRPGNARVSIQLEHPFTLPGPIAAFVTGTVAITFKSNGRNQEREFRIYNDSLAQDVAHPRIYYPVRVR
jgi:hypothetical protein